MAFGELPRPSLMVRAAEGPRLCTGTETQEGSWQARTPGEGAGKTTMMPTDQLAEAVRHSGGYTGPGHYV